MISQDLGPEAIPWLRRYLAEGGSLSHRLIDQLNQSVHITAVAPPDLKIDVNDLNVGGRNLERNAVLQVVRKRVTDYVTSNASAFIVVENLWAQKQYPCGGNETLPWIVVQANRQEELYWVWDRRWPLQSPDVVLGASSGRRFLAVMSIWEGNLPELCTSVTDAFMSKVSSGARSVIVEIFDGESYLVVDLAIGSSS